jgi:hypothetical protein
MSEASIHVETRVMNPVGGIINYEFDAISYTLSRDGYMFQLTDHTFRHIPFRHVVLVDITYLTPRYERKDKVPGFDVTLPDEVDVFKGIRAMDRKERE